MTYPVTPLSHTTEGPGGYGTETGIVLVYEHPQGSIIRVYPDGTMDARKPDGKRKKTSAYPEALYNGHGQWQLVRREVYVRESHDG